MLREEAILHRITILTCTAQIQQCSNVSALHAVHKSGTFALQVPGNRELQLANKLYLSTRSCLLKRARGLLPVTTFFYAILCNYAKDTQIAFKINVNI